MIFRQITHDDLGCASYLVGDHHAGVAAVIDPRFEIDEYLELARYMNVRIEHVLETHNHADHVSGHGRLAAATGATIHIHRLAAPDYDHVPFDDGWELELGSVIVRALHTPGHRPEHTAFALIDTARGTEPWALLSGDTLFVGDVARPDLAVERSDGARGIFRSLRDQILSLPDECEVWPGHLGGSMCGGPGMDMKVSSTIGYERRHNPVLAESDEERFVEQSLAKLGPQPPNFKAIVELNRGPLVTDGVHVMPLTSRQVELKRQQGALLVDVRTDQQFDEAHVPGAVCITRLGAGFGTKLAWVVDHDQEIVLIGRDNDDARVAARLATAVGVRRIAGFLEGGMTSWREERWPVASIERVDVDRLAALREEDPGLQILDVRERAEYDAGHIPGSSHLAYHDVTSIPPDMDPARPIAAICGSGQRAALAASLLARHGAQRVLHVTPFGVPYWGRSGHPLERT
ncbi:MAG TPA: MBL fold metallo-hydrolase [Solirubrobacteraceae bacterium]|jgi:glyoxylase-like metal-dependent hydrolase (beta-lactamase superfamily II)/rhodanese-related sulfurtransferase|nr:MBL fold metallo-hydrolase [Solirubrobacteraceae bacterium]